MFEETNSWVSQFMARPILDPIVPSPSGHLGISLAGRIFPSFGPWTDPGAPSFSVGACRCAGYTEAWKVERKSSVRDMCIQYVYTNKYIYIERESKVL